MGYPEAGPRAGSNNMKIGTAVDERTIRNTNIGPQQYHFANVTLTIGYAK